MKKRTVKKIFIAIAVLLPLQYITVGVVGVRASEPWPAFVFPGFKSVYADEEKVEVEKAVFAVYRNGRRYSVDSSVLFHGIQESQRLGFIDTNFSNVLKAETWSEETREWLNAHISSGYPALQAPDSLEVRWVKETLFKGPNAAPPSKKEDKTHFFILL